MLDSTNRDWRSILGRTATFLLFLNPRPKAEVRRWLALMSNLGLSTQKPLFVAD